MITNVRYPIFRSPQISLVRVHSLLRKVSASDEMLSYRIVALPFSEEFLPYIARRENSVAIMKTTAWTVTDRGRHFSLVQSVQTGGCGAHPVSYPMDTGSARPVPRRVLLTSIQSRG